MIDVNEGYFLGIFATWSHYLKNWLMILLIQGQWYIIPSNDRNDQAYSLSFMQMQYFQVLVED